MRPRADGESGRIDFIKVLMVAVVVAVAYLGYVFLPVYYDDYEVVLEMKRAANKAYVPRYRRVEDVDAMLTDNFKKLNIQNEEYAADGSVIRRAMDFSSDNWNIDIEDSPPEITIDLSYDREIIFPVLKKQRTLHFHHVVKESLKDITW